MASTATMTTTIAQVFFMFPPSSVSQGVTGYRASLRQLEHVRGVRRPLVTMMRGDDAAAAGFEPAIQPIREIRARRAIEAGEGLIEQRERGLARPGAREQHTARLAI